MDTGGVALRSGILHLALKTAEELYSCYMPQIRNGGLFIPSRRDYQLGDRLFVLLELMDESEKIPLAGKVVWITPKGLGGDRHAGVGIQFPDNSAQLVTRIETYLAGVQIDRPTFTL